MVPRTRVVGPGWATFPRWASVSAIAAAVVGAAGVVTLVLFFALEAPHIRGTHPWGTDPNEVLGYANDVLGIIWFALLIPFAVALWSALKPVRRWRDRAALAMGLAAMVIGVASGLGLVTHLLDASVEGAISGLGSVLVVAWIGLTARRATIQGVLPLRLAQFGQLLAVVLIGSLVLAVLTLALPRSVATNALTAVAAAPGVLAYLGVFLWLAAVGKVLLKSESLKSQAAQGRP